MCSDGPFSCWTLNFPNCSCSSSRHLFLTECNKGKIGMNRKWLESTMNQFNWSTMYQAKQSLVTFLAPHTTYLQDKKDVLCLLQNYDNDKPFQYGIPNHNFWCDMTFTLLPMVPFAFLLYSLWIVVILCVNIVSPVSFHCSTLKTDKQTYKYYEKNIYGGQGWCIWNAVIAFLSVPVHLSGRGADKVMHDGRVHQLFAREIKYKQIEENAGKQILKMLLFVCSFLLRHRFLEE